MNTLSEIRNLKRNKKRQYRLLDQPAVSKTVSLDPEFYEINKEFYEALIKPTVRKNFSKLI